MIGVLGLTIFDNACYSKYYIKREKKIDKHLLNETEIELPKEILQVLAPFKFMTEMFSHSKVTNSRDLPTLFYLKKAYSFRNRFRST